MAIENLGESGHSYFLHPAFPAGEAKKDGCFIIGDAAGLATVDLGEGIGPAIQTGLMCAGEIDGVTALTMAVRGVAVESAQMLADNGADQVVAGSNPLTPTRIHYPLGSFF
ncbi:MAG: hypothetical protein OES38_00105 [Gammaproteobacteria bacterium]|nr:hypothetical protein [Gammaproteobacteria bacterium]